MPDLTETIRRSFIAAVERNGPDLVLTLHGLRRHGVRARAQLVFSRVTHVDSEDLRNELAHPELQAGTRIDGFQMANGTARLEVSRVDMHDIYPVLHTISCEGVSLRASPHFRDTARAWLRKAAKF